MNQEYPLNALYTRFAEGLIDRRTLESDLFTFIFKNKNRYKMKKWDQDVFSDYVSWMYPRLQRAIRNYKDTGSTFDAYIGTLLHYCAKTYKISQADRNIMEHSCWRARNADYVCDEDAAYLEVPDAPRTLTNPRQVLMLALKCYYHLSQDFIERIALSIGLPAEELSRMVEAVAERRKHHDEERRLLQERICGQYYRCLSFEQRMHAAPENSAHRIEMGIRWEHAKTRLNSMRKRLASIQRSAKNADVALVLGIPKGTVDSNLYSLRWKWRINRE
jgi:hypothetical protein